MNIKVLLLTPENSGSCPSGTFIAKNTLLGAVSYVCPKYHYACLYSGFYSVEFEAFGENSLFTFLDEFSVPAGLEKP